MMKNCEKIVLTLDAGGTNLVFSAIRNGEEIVSPVTIPTVTDDLDACLQTVKTGFETICSKLTESPSAISFAFPGPADYEAGIIGDLPNFPAFRGGVALGPFLEKHFGIPVFINNDGNLFAYGEAIAGLLPEINAKLEANGNPKRYKNLIGVTLGTGFGGGVVINKQLLFGDNQIGGYLWCMPNKKYEGMIAEESVSIRAIKRVYSERSGDNTEYTPKDIYDIAEGLRPGNKEAAITAFEELGEMAGHTIAAAVTLIDGLVVIGGGVSGASKYIMPALMKELRSETGMMSGVRFNRIQSEVYCLDNQAELDKFLESTVCKVNIPGTEDKVDYQTVRRTGVALSHNGASRSIALGAYWFAVNQLERK